MLFLYKKYSWKGEKNILHISLAKSAEAIDHFACEILPLICLTVCQWSTHITSNKTSTKKIQFFYLKVELWVQ